MIIKSYELDKKLQKKNQFLLLYGSNTALIEETINNKLKPIFSKNVTSYSETELLANKDDFIESLINQSFFETDRLIIINQVTDKIINAFKEIYNKRYDDLQIILKANNLEKKSKIRSFFEKEKDLIIVPFYEDTYQSLLFVAQNFFKENNIKISIQNINYIIEKTKLSRIALKNELEKIKNFSQNKKSVEFNDLLKLINSAENYAISEITDCCLNKNKKKTVNILNDHNSSFEDNILILKSFLYKLKRLKKLREELENHKDQDQDQVIASYKPPIFWKDKIIIKQQLKNQSRLEINSLIKEINILEMTLKKNPQLSTQIMNNFILERFN